MTKIDVTDKKLQYNPDTGLFDIVPKVFSTTKSIDDAARHAIAKGYFDNDEFQTHFQRAILNGLQSRFDGAVHFDDDLSELLSITREVVGYFYTERDVNYRTRKRFLKREYLDLARQIALTKDREWNNTPHKPVYYEYSKPQNPYDAIQAMGLFILFDAQRREKTFDGAAKLSKICDEMQKKGVVSKLEPQLWVEPYATVYNSIKYFDKYNTDDNNLNYPLNWVTLSAVPRFLSVLHEQRSTLFYEALEDLPKLVSSLFTNPERDFNDLGQKPHSEWRINIDDFNVAVGRKIAPDLPVIPEILKFLNDNRKSDFKAKKINEVYELIDSIKKQQIDDIQTKMEKLALSMRQLRCLWGETIKL